MDLRLPSLEAETNNYEGREIDKESILNRATFSRIRSAYGIRAYWVCHIWYMLLSPLQVQ